MAINAIAEDYFRSMNPLAAKIHEDIEEAKTSYENIWNSLSDKEKTEIINESIIKPDIALKYALIDTLDFDINDPPIRRDDLMSFFGREHGQKLIQDENRSWRDEHSAPFLYQTKSQLNLCILNELREKKELKSIVGDDQPVLELALSHSKVVSELKNALKSHDMLKSTNYSKPAESQEREPISSPTGFISKLIGNFKSKDDDKERLVSNQPTQIVASSDNFFRTNFKSPQSDLKFDKDYRTSMAKSSSDLSEENRGLLSSVSQASSATDFHSCEDIALTESTETLAPSVGKTGYDFLDNW